MHLVKKLFQSEPFFPWEKQKDTESATYRQHSLYRRKFSVQPSSALFSMTEKELEQRVQTPSRGHFRHQFFICATLTLASMSAGYTLGSVAPKIRARFNAGQGTYSDRGRFASIVALGLAAGTMVISVLSVAHGPRLVLLIGGVCNIGAWMLLCFTSTTGMERFGMFMCAFFSAGYLHCGSYLISDTIHESYYYPFYVIFYTGQAFGLMLGYVVGFCALGSAYTDMTGALIVGLFFSMLLCCPESPVFLYAQNPTAARKALCFIRGNEDTYVLLRQISKDQEARVLSASNKYMLFRSVIYKALFIIMALAVLQCFHAYHICMMYDLSLWYSSGKYYTIVLFTPKTDGVIIGVAYYVVGLITEAVNRRMTYGLRKPVLASAISVPCTLAANAVFIYLLFNTDYVKEFAWVSFVLRVAHIAAFNLSGTWALKVMIADYLPDQVQIWAVISVFTLQYTTLAFLFWLSHHLETMLSSDLIIGIFTMFSFIGVPFCFYFIIESRGRTLQQMQIAIGGNPIGTRSTFRYRYQLQMELQRQARENTAQSGQPLKQAV